MRRHPYAALDEQRTATRFGKEPDSAYAVVHHPEMEAFIAQVHEESLGGIGLILEDPRRFGVGQNVEIAYLDCLLRAVVRHIEPWEEEGTYLVGFQCLSAD